MQSSLIQTHWPHAHRTIIQAGSPGSMVSPEPYRISVVMQVNNVLTILTIMKIIEKVKKFNFTVVTRGVA